MGGQLPLFPIQNSYLTYFTPSLKKCDKSPYQQKVTFLL